MGINRIVNPEWYNEYTLPWELIREFSRLAINDTDRIEDKLGPGWVDATDSLFLFSDTYLKSRAIGYRIFYHAQQAHRFAMPYITEGTVSGVLVQTTITVAARASAIASGLMVGYDFVKRYPKVAARFSNFVLPNGITEDVDPEWLESYMDNNCIWMDVRDGLVFGFQDLVGFFTGLSDEERDEINYNYTIPTDWNENDGEFAGTKYSSTDFSAQVYYLFQGINQGDMYNENVSICDTYTLEPANYLYTTQPRVGTGNAHSWKTVLTMKRNETSIASFQELDGSFKTPVKYPIGPIGFHEKQTSSGWTIYPICPSKQNMSFRKTSTSGGAVGKTVYQGTYGNDLAAQNGISAGTNKVGTNVFYASDGSSYQGPYRLKRTRNVYCKAEYLDYVKGFLRHSSNIPVDYVDLNPPSNTNSDVNPDYASLSAMQKQRADEYFKYQVLEDNGALTDSYRYGHTLDYQGFETWLFKSNYLMYSVNQWDNFKTCKQMIFLKGSCVKRDPQGVYSFFPFITKSSIIKNTQDDFIESIPWEVIPSIDPIEPDNIFFYKITNDEPGPDDPPIGEDDMNNPFIPVVPDNDGDVPFPTIPYFPEIGSSGLVVVYNPTPLEMKDFGRWLWNPVDTALNTVLKMFQNAMDAIITLHLLYCKPEISAKIPIRVGYLDSNVEAAHVVNQFKTINMGQVFIPEIYGTYLDYSGNTEVELYLPFIGFVQLDANDVMNSAIEIEYMVDCYTGSCVANVKVKKGPPNYDFNVVEYIFMGNCAMQVPVTGASWGQLYSVAISAATAGMTGKVVAGVAHKTAGGIAKAAAQSAGNIAGGAMIGAGHGLAHSQIQVSRSGNLSANYGVMTGRKPYVVVRTPIRADAEGFNRIYGYQANANKRIKNLFGYLRVKECNIKVSGFAEENAEIERFLKSGVLYGKQSN